MAQAQTQRGLEHANRLRTMGRLSASIAHEVIQPIAATVTNAQVGLLWLDARPPDLGEVRQAFGRILADANRAGSLVGGVRSLLQKAPRRQESVDINAVVLEIVALVRGEASKRGVSVQIRLAESLALVEGDRIALQQVLLNLVVNALKAMRSVETGPRDLLVRTARVPDGILVAVADSGPGVPPERATRLFEAAETNGRTGSGTGLPLCRSIIERHGGRLWFAANAPRGALFQFTLPAAAGA
jgi:C4-dicarboxylate-specific signal transduction histidine kinase